MIGKLPRFLLGFESRQNSRSPDLGARELQLLELLWESNGATAQGVQSQIQGEGISLSTVQSTLERLHRKRLVSRIKEGRAYRYQVSMSKSELISCLLRDMTDQVAAGDLAPMISGFVNYVSTEAPELLGELSESLYRKHRLRDANDEI